MNLPVWVGGMGLEPVPELYRGPYSREKMNELANRKESITGREEHISEGIVIRPAWATRYSDKVGGRLQLKHKSDAYLLRKGGTEFS